MICKKLCCLSYKLMLDLEVFFDHCLLKMLRRTKIFCFLMMRLIAGVRAAR